MAIESGRRTVVVLTASPSMQGLHLLEVLTSVIRTAFIGVLLWVTAAPAMAQDYGHNRGWNNGGGARNAESSAPARTSTLHYHIGYR